MGRPVSVARTSRDVSCAAPVKRKGACDGAVAMLVMMLNKGLAGAC